MPVELREEENLKNYLNSDRVKKINFFISKDDPITIWFDRGRWFISVKISNIPHKTFTIEIEDNQTLNYLFDKLKRQRDIAHNRLGIRWRDCKIIERGRKKT